MTINVKRIMLVAAVLAVAMKVCAQDAPQITTTAVSPTVAEKPASVPAVSPQERAGVPTDTADDPLNDFQRFIAISSGQTLPIFGQELFRGVPSTFAPVDRVPVTADYVVGAGDELLIRAWGQIDIDLRVAVDRTGSIFMPRIGQVRVAGLRYEQLPSFLRSQIGRIYRNFDLSVTLGELRSIQVLVVGSARRPGTYTVSSLSTLVNALFASGGPSPRGTMRRIQVKRASQTITELDLYDLLVRGEKSRDLALQSGDVIYIPPVGPLVALAGGVKEPAIYELNGETSLANLLALAGGLNTTATDQRATVERIRERVVRRVEQLALDAEGMRFRLQDGDFVRLASVSTRFENAVTLRGHVAAPGRYAYREQMRVRDLIPSRALLIPERFWGRQNELAERPAGKYGDAELRNDVRRSGAEINWDYAVVQRLNVDDLSTRLIPFNLGRAIADASSLDNVALEAGDVVTIFSQDDLKAPVERQGKFVRLEGEIVSGGVYRAEPGETLRKLLVRAGGFTAQAYAFGAEFTRESVRLDQQQRMEQLIRQTEAELNSLRNSHNGDNDERRLAEIESRERLLTKLRQLRPTGRVVLELKPTASGADAIPEMALEDGDRFFVPDTPSTVTVVGAVYNENAFIYRKGESISEYLSLAGGATRDADRSRIYVVRADGTVVARGGLKPMPGDTLVVPIRVARGSFIRGVKDWTQIISQFTLGAAAVRVLERQ